MLLDVGQDTWFKAGNMNDTKLHVEGSHMSGLDIGI